MEWSLILNQVLQYGAFALPALIIVLNPLSGSSVIMSIAGVMSEQRRLRLIKRASVTAFWILFVFAVGGSIIFKVLGITIGAFQIAGGIIMFAAGMKIREGFDGAPQGSGDEQHQEMLETFSITPLATPIISGPGAITTILILTGNTKHHWELGVLILCIAISVFVIYLSMRYADKLFKFLGKSGTKIVARLMGLIIAVMAVQFIINGIKSVLPTIVPYLKGHF